MFDALAPCCAAADRTKKAKTKSASSLMANPLLGRSESYRRASPGTSIAMKRELARPGEIRFPFNQENAMKLKNISGSWSRCGLCPAACGAGVGGQRQDDSCPGRPLGHEQRRQRPHGRHAEHAIGRRAEGADGRRASALRRRPRGRRARARAARQSSRPSTRTATA